MSSLITSLEQHVVTVVCAVGTSSSRRSSIDILSRECVSFAVIACDGLWKSFSNLEAITFASEQLEAVKKMDLQQETNESRETAELRTVAEKMAAEAVRRKCGDNVSVIIIKLELLD
ncbi:unnamed protein product [Caenorhabditis sp. 36 PRJEB53466]|nr:unnamed protein product [Caenorhabditis sp. 36 PRJEB53466]